MIYNCYYLTAFSSNGKLPWPEEIQIAYSAYRDVFGDGGYIFEAGSQQELQFIADAERLNLTVISVPYFRSTSKTLLQQPYYVWLVKGGKGFVENGLMDRTNACVGDGKFLCTTGEYQQRKITYDPKKISKLEIMQFSLPSIFVISKRVKMLFDAAGLTGYRTIPCIETGNKEPNSDLRYTAETEARAEYFQLVITEHTDEPMHLRVGSKFRWCDKCGVVYLYGGGLTGYFPSKGLRHVDFQTTTQFKLPTGEEFRFVNHLAVVSARAIKLIQDHKLTGLAKFKSEPFNIPHWAVDVH